MIISPLVSVIIPVYNREQFLSQAISSVVNQSFTNFELIICDDGSTDKSLEIANTYAKLDSRIRVLTEKINHGAAYTLKKGFAAANINSKYLCQLDSDDLFDGDTLGKTVKVLEENPSCGLVYTHYQDINVYGERLYPGWRCSYEYSPDQILTVFMLFHFRLFRKSIYHLAGGIDLNFNLVEDYELCLRMSELTEIILVPEILYLYRVHIGSVHTENRLEVIKLTLEAIQAALVRRQMAETHFIDVRYNPKITIRKKDEG